MCMNMDKYLVNSKIDMKRKLMNDYCHPDTI